MAFKKSSQKSDVAATPVDLFRSLPRREFPTEMPHQRAILEAYVDRAADKSDVALQLPTGSGKTLVGLLIAEWRRRKFEEKVVYLCPTRQLVNQTVEQATEKYGLDVVGFTGSARDYDPTDVTKYRTSGNVAVTTYSSLFNTNPFFDDADTIIIDDAHAAENYIASVWSLQIDPGDHETLHDALADIVKPHLSQLDYARLTGEWHSTADVSWVDKVPTPVFSAIRNELLAALEENIGEDKLKYPWSLLREHLDACQMYLSARGILIRPIVPPTWSLSAFDSANHRVFMSATLGEGGDLERLTGRARIFRLPIPEGFELQGVGRRFFMFPGMSLEPYRCDRLRLDLMKEAGRSVVLAPSDAACAVIAKQVDEKLGYRVFSAADIEESKTAFVGSKQAVAIMAGRYDGIDFPQKECRLLCVDGLPRAMNLQERFLMAKMGAAVLFNERIQTRVLQAIGRCTRALQDYSAIFVTGGELQDYLADRKRRKFFYPELQAELEFGVAQSTEVSEEEFLDNFDIFLENDDEWADVNDEIIAATKKKKRSPFPAMDELGAAVKFEIQYQKAMWSSDYAEAYAAAKNVLGVLNLPELRGYRALWHYLAGAAAFLASEAGDVGMKKAARSQFASAKKATTMLPWLNHLERYRDRESNEPPVDDDLDDQIERIESFLCELGTTHEGAFAKLESEIRDGLRSTENFEQAHLKLGQLLGFSAGKHESDASPDPWWLGKKSCLVFEDHAGAAETSVLGAKKARQAAGHPNWMKDNVAAAASADFFSVLVSPVKKAESGALPHLKTVHFWPLGEFRKWARNALGVIRELRGALPGPGDIEWRARAAELLEANALTMTTIKALLKDNVARDKLAG